MAQCGASSAPPPALPQVLPQSPQGWHSSDPHLVSRGWDKAQALRAATKLAAAQKLFRVKVSHRESRFFANREDAQRCRRSVAAKEAAQNLPPKPKPGIANVVLAAPPTHRPAAWADIEPTYPPDFKYTVCPGYPGPKNVALDEISPLLKSRARA